MSLAKSLANAKGAQNRPQHVPAWKRIGLKLKYAKNSVEDPSDEKQNGFQSTTRSNEDNHGNKPPQLQFYEDGPPAKKRRTLTEPARDSAPEPQQRVINKIPIETSDNSSRASQDVAEDYGTFSNDQDDLTKTTTNQRNQPSSERPRRSVSSEASLLEGRRKFVTFTSDTKVEDGSSASTPFKNGTSDQQQNGTGATETDQELAEPPSKSKKRSKADRKRVENEAATATDDLASQQVPEYVRYIELFHHDKDSWKFNKNKQNDLFKNLFNVYRIPSEHNEAISHYLSGLQGVGARQHLIGTATAVLKDVATKESEFDSISDDMSGLESGEARRRAYSAALHRHIERWQRSGAGRGEDDDRQLEEMRVDVEKGRRAETVLHQLLQKDLRSEQATTEQNGSQSGHNPASTRDSESRSTSATNGTPNGDNKAKRKKRKSRTQASSDDSSSESDSPAKVTPGPRTVHEALSNHSDPKTTAKSTSAFKPTSGKHVIFDDDLLEKMFGPKQQSYNETAPKRKPGEEKARGFAYTHGTRADESDSESESESDSDSSSESESDEDSDDE